MAMAPSTSASRVLIILMAAAALLLVGAGALSLDLYDETCPEAEAAVTAAVRQGMAKDRTVAAGLLRMHFHDCFVRVRAYGRCLGSSSPSCCCIAHSIIAVS